VEDGESAKIDVTNLPGFVMINGQLMHKDSPDFPADHLDDKELCKWPLPLLTAAGQFPALKTWNRPDRPCLYPLLTIVNST
jgi:hypothetical protein